MRTFELRNLGVLSIVAALAVLGGCAQTGGVQSGAGSTADTGDTGSHHCNTLAAGAIGALAGSLFGKGKGHIAGAVIGAGIGAFACMVYNYHARKVRDAQAVEAEYKQQRGALPTRNTVSDYQSTLEPGATVKAGSTATMQSRITVLRGTQGKVPQVQEELTLLSPEGKQLSSVTKNATAIQGTGEYETNFEFSLPKGIQEGRYTVRSTLYLNGQQLRANEVPMLVVG